ncbi:MAG: spermidine synthase [Belnapia sp.]|nr:spermidine synthase [Belnapia sp.]
MPRLALAFFCSGFSALMCQVVWQRMLGIFAGSDTVSAALVVAAFLGGLGIGSLIGAKLADRLSARQALLGFALCEVGVAAFAPLSKLFLYDVLALGLAGVVDNQAAIFALCFAGLILPTTLMGASLPLLARTVATSLDTVAQRIGWLYALNTLGAGAGTLLGGWFIIGSMGYVGALWVAAILNLAAAGIALSLRPRLPTRLAVAPAPAFAPPGKAGTSLPLWCLLVFLSGYVIVALEIIWVRVMGQIGQFHAYLFPTVLGLFLLADGAGIAFASWILHRLPDPRRTFFLLQSVGFVLATILLIGLWFALSYWPLDGYLTIDRWRLADRPLLLALGVTILLVSPPAFLIGMTFPVVQRAIQHDLASVGARIGWVQLANIAGNAAGSLVTGLVSLHLFGTMGTLRLLAALSLALLLGWLALGGWRRRRPEAGLAMACAALMALLPGNAAFWSRLHAQEPGGYAAWGEDRSGVAYFRASTDAGRKPGSFFIMGYVQGYQPFLAEHMLLGVAGPLLHPAPRRVLLIGIGSGGTPWGATVSPHTQLLRMVEIVAPTIGTLRQIASDDPGGPVAAVLGDPRLDIVQGDGRRLLAGSEERYDVIEADAIRAESSHSGMLYSSEYLALVRRRLAPGGLYVQWAPTWRAVATFTAAFPHAVMLRPANIMIGSESPIDHAALPGRLAEASVVQHLRRGNPRLEAPQDLIANPPLMWRPDTPRLGEVLTDMRPRDEFFLNNGIRATSVRAPELEPPAGPP